MPNRGLNRYWSDLRCWRFEVWEIELVRLAETGGKACGAAQIAITHPGTNPGKRSPVGGGAHKSRTRVSVGTAPVQCLQTGRGVYLWF